MKVAHINSRVSSTSSLRCRPFSSAGSRRRVALSVSAQETPAPNDAQGKPVAAPALVMEWSQDNEGLKELMGFGGSAPERTNGRAAMLGFVAAMGAELATGVPVAQQFADAALSVILVNILLGFGSVAPKFLSGTSLAELHASAQGQNLVGTVQDWTQVLKVFDTNNELWIGRIAMIGIVGLIITEAVTGKAFF